jgi:ribosomal protein S27E
MAVYPVVWQVECDVCGNVSHGNPGVSAQEILTVALQHGWGLQIRSANDVPSVVLRCDVCAATLAGDDGKSPAADHEHHEHQE